MAMLRRKTKDERRENCVILSGAVRRSRRISVALGFVLLFAVVAFAAPKSASAYYGDAAFQYIENRLPTAEITCNEGLQYYPNDQKLQMLLDRIHEAKDEQKNENKKNDPKNDQNQDQNNQDQNQDQNQNQNGDQSSSSAQNDQNQDQQNQGQNGQSSDSQQQSSDSNGGSGEQQQPEQSEGNSSDSNGSDQEQPQPLAPGELTPEEAAQLLKDFDEQNGERKPWKPVRGQVRPAKDW
ncbi:hypothetical protein [Fibrobacter sp. UWB11]|uniref:hypothetical protein n=1 Tax=Fibrobacter sp. UWB11 TaxID=1896202 RepID=UPI00092A3FE9|nr:hypothetical protein [Fibrobacter sp. UWB11]SIO40335.1 hypothetical protein SAMN05720758_2699 [Fibrobacter sp. UWB11]